MATYQVSTEPANGIAIDAHSIEWRRGTDGDYWPQPCGACGQTPCGPLPWERLVIERGPLRDPV
jgi:hypothetical protein